jgi:Zn finger protein HypA/HybF involved in hydrogenase expression
MNKAELESLIAQRKTQRVIAKELGVSQSTIRFWMRKFNLRTHRGPHGTNISVPSRKCKCGEQDPAKFYGHKHSICAACHNRYNHDQGAIKVAEIRRLLGGKCTICGYDKYPCSLDFHHLDSSTKVDSLRRMRNWSWEKIHLELVKGVLLCKNCHAAVTYGLLEFNGA